MHTDGTITIGKINNSVKKIETKTLAVSAKNYSKIHEQLKSELFKSSIKKRLSIFRAHYKRNNALFYAQISHKSKTNYLLRAYPYLNKKTSQIENMELFFNPKKDGLKNEIYKEGLTLLFEVRLTLSKTTQSGYFIQCSRNSKKVACYFLEKILEKLNENQSKKILYKTVYYNPNDHVLAVVTNSHEVALTKITKANIARLLWQKIKIRLIIT